MNRNRTYTIKYISGDDGSARKVDVIAANMADAYDKAVYEAIPAGGEGLPYAAWVDSVTYQNGNVRCFKTFCGHPY